MVNLRVSILKNPRQCQTGDTSNYWNVLQTGFIEFSQGKSAQLISDLTPKLLSNEVHAIAKGVCLNPEKSQTTSNLRYFDCLE